MILYAKVLKSKLKYDPSIITNINLSQIVLLVISKILRNYFKDTVIYSRDN